MHSIPSLGLLLAFTVIIASYTSALSTSNNNNKAIMSTAAAATRVAARAAAIGKLHPAHSVLLLCDVQDRFRPLIYRMETVVNTCRYMTSVAGALDIPIVGTQQYTKVFGETCKDTFANPVVLAATPIFEKKLFSMLTTDVKSKLDELDKSSYIIMGIEAHVCVQQTCLDLLEQGNDVHVIVDGVSSQQPIDRAIALDRLQQAGAFLTTAQSAAFMLTQSAEHANFKTVSKLTVEHMKLPNEFNNDYGK